MGKVYERTENGSTQRVSVSEALAEVNHVMMGGRRQVRTMSSSHGSHDIEYKDGRTVRLIEVDAQEPEEEPREWVGTHSNFSHLHRMDETNHARCNRRIRPTSHPSVSAPHGPWTVAKKTRSEVLNGEYANLYSFCPRCDAK